MKHLPQYILEGIFDIEDNVRDNAAAERAAYFNVYDSDLWRYLVPLYSNKPIPQYGWERLKEDWVMDISRKTLVLPNVDVMLDSTKRNPLSDPYSLTCGSFYIGDPYGHGPHPNPIENGGGLKEVHVNNSVHIDGFCEKANGFKFYIGGGESRIGNKYNKVIVTFADALKELKSEFVFVDPNDSLINLHCDSFPNLKDTKSNVENIILYDPSFFDNSDIKTKMDKFFGGGTITANGITKTKNIRNIVAIANNMRKYNAIVPTDVIPVGSLSDLIDLRGMPDVKKVIMKNNNVHIMFVRPENDLYINRYAMFVRMNNMKLYKNASKQEMIDLVLRCKTKDGWVVIIEPESF